MRTSIDITELQRQALDDIARANNLSRADVVRAAIDEYINGRQRVDINGAFGLWGESVVDGLFYQEDLRGEW